MRAATQTHTTDAIRILDVGRDITVHAAGALPSLLEPGDLVVVNDAATLPASIAARTRDGAFVELRLAGQTGDVRFHAALLGAGDYRVRTEDRPAPPRVQPGDELTIGEGLGARVVALSSFSERFVEIELLAVSTDEVWRLLYELGRPVQYAHVPEPLALWDVQNVWAARPWAVEMPSAGRAIRGATLAALAVRGIPVVAITHAAGLSATGDPRIDCRLPLPERYEVSEGTARAIRETKARGGRVIAIGTSVVRALESTGGTAGAGTTSLLIGMATRLAVVDAILTGVHEVDTSHFALLGAFAKAPVLAAALDTAEKAGLLGHELGDAWLVWRDPSIGSHDVPAGVVEPARLTRLALFLRPPAEAEDIEAARERRARDTERARGMGHNTTVFVERAADHGELRLVDARTLALQTLPAR